jgi:hypothetical protein
VGARPAHPLFIQVYTNGNTVGTLQINPNGTMLACSLVGRAGATGISTGVTTIRAAGNVKVVGDARRR